MKYAAPSFSHIYIEEGALQYSDTELIIKKFPRAQIVTIGDYKHLFSRPRQDWRAQKGSTNLILAVKKNNFVYPGSAAAQSFGETNFYYNSLILNCLYDCHYCYLQGMYPSANIVMFVNSIDFFRATSELLKELSSVYLCISYDTDLLAFENLIPHCRRWIEYTHSNPGLTVETRTKSCNFSSISDLTPTDDFILAFTLSPKRIIEKYETTTARLAARLSAASAAQSRGWKVRLCFDPVLATLDWKEQYHHLIRETFSTLDNGMIRDVSLGVFRTNSEYFKRMRRQRPDSDLLAQDFQVESSCATYPPEIRREIEAYCRAQLEDYLAPELIHCLTNEPSNNSATTLS